MQKTTKLKIVKWKDLLEQRCETQFYIFNKFILNKETYYLHTYIPGEKTRKIYIYNKKWEPS